jgi:hypothetical protein
MLAIFQIAKTANSPWIDRQVVKTSQISIAQFLLSWQPAELPERQ